jgi:predicted dehydrogenase
MKSGDLSRRTFLFGSAAVAAGCATAGTKPRRISPNEKLNIAGIGFGGMGKNNLRTMSASENIMALCDVDHTFVKPVFEAFPEARRYKDYREMLAQEKDLDAVVIATPDHSHAVITMAALKAGKHVFCQKPLTHDVYEARMIAQASEETGLITQMGIQGHAGEGNRQVSEWIQAGVIGEVREVEAFCTDTYYPWGHAGWSPAFAGRPKDTPPAPEGMDWDLWLGPAPARPYHPNYHPMKWRAYWDFGSGWMSDRGVHTMDPVVWALNLGQPTRVNATVTGVSDEMHPVASMVQFEFEARKNMPPVSVKWYTGMRPLHPAGVPGNERIGDATGGILFKGSEGLLTCDTYGSNPRLLPAARMKDFTPPAKTIPRVTDNSIEKDWLDSIRNGKKSCANFTYGGLVTEICAVGNIAKRVNGPVEWDGVNMKITNNEDANKYVRTKYREGWSL